MKKIIFSVIISCFFTSNIYSQLTYQRLIKAGGGGWYGDIKKADLTLNNGLIIAGAGLLKTDSLGQHLWAKTYAEFEDVVALPTGDFVALEKIYSDTSIILMKFNSNGDILWSKKYVDTLFNRSSSAKSLKYTADMGFIIAGKITDSTLLDKSYFIKTDANGTVVWTRIVDAQVPVDLNSIKQLSDSSYIAVGTSVVNSIERNIILIKLYKNGSLAWVKKYGGASSEYGRDVTETSDGGFAVIGTTTSYAYAGQADVLLINTDAFGHVVFSKIYGSTLVDEGYIIQKTADEGFAIAARMQSTSGGGGNCGALGPCYDFLFIKTDKNGDTLWTKMYGGDGLDFPFFLKRTTDNGYIIAGTSGPSSFDSFGGTYIVKTDSLGNSPCNTYNANNVMVASPTITAVNILAYTDSAGVAFSTTVQINDWIVNPARDSLLCISLPLNINETLNNIQNIVVYPNPGTYELNISAEIVGGTMLLYSIVGELLKTIAITAGETTINTTSLSVGTYIYSITNKTTNKTIYGKWIKK